MLNIKKVLKIKVVSFIIIAVFLFNPALYASSEKTKDEKPRAGMVTKEQVKNENESQKADVKKRQLIENIRGKEVEKTAEDELAKNTEPTLPVYGSKPFHREPGYVHISDPVVPPGNYESPDREPVDPVYEPPDKNPGPIIGPPMPPELPDSPVGELPPGGTIYEPPDREPVDPVFDPMPPVVPIDFLVVEIPDNTYKASNPLLGIGPPPIVVLPLPTGPQPTPQPIISSPWDDVSDEKVINRLIQDMADRLGISPDEIVFRSMGGSSAIWDTGRPVYYITLIGPDGQEFTYLSDGMTDVNISTKAQVEFKIIGPPPIVVLPLPTGPQPTPQPIISSPWDDVSDKEVINRLIQDMADRLGVSPDEIAFRSMGGSSAIWDTGRPVYYITLISPDGEEFTYLSDGMTDVNISTKTPEPLSRNR